MSNELSKEIRFSIQNGVIKIEADLLKIAEEGARSTKTKLDNVALTAISPAVRMLNIEKEFDVFREAA